MVLAILLTFFGVVNTHLPSSCDPGDMCSLPTMRVSIPYPYVCFGNLLSEGDINDGQIEFYPQDNHNVDVQFPNNLDDVIQQGTKVSYAYVCITRPRH